METKTYTCNTELAAILNRHGFIDTTKKYDQIKGKREFRKGRTSTMVIYFDYENFKMFEGTHGNNTFERASIIEADDLRLLLWYVAGNKSDREAISDGHFDLRQARQTHATMTSLLGFSKEFNHSTPESRKFDRLLGKHRAIVLD